MNAPPANYVDLVRRSGSPRSARLAFFESS